MKRKSAKAARVYVRIEIQDGYGRPLAMAESFEKAGKLDDLRITVDHVLREAYLYLVELSELAGMFQ